MTLSCWDAGDAGSYQSGTNNFLSLSLWNKTGWGESPRSRQNHMIILMEVKEVAAKRPERTRTEGVGRGQSGVQAGEAPRWQEAARMWELTDAASSPTAPGCRLGEHQGWGLLETPAPSWRSVTPLGTGEESDPILLLVLLPGELSPVPPAPPVQLRLGTIFQVLY